MAFLVLIVCGEANWRSPFNYTDSSGKVPDYLLRLKMFVPDNKIFEPTVGPTAPRPGANVTGIIHDFVARLLFSIILIE